MVTAQPPAPVPSPADQQNTDHSVVPAGPEVVRSEEQLHVSTTTYATERVRVSKRIITEEKTITVSVRREVFTLEREPISDSGPGTEPDSSRLQDEPSQTRFEVLLHEEQVVVQKKVVPIERVTVITDLITAQQDVTAQVRTEQIETTTTPYDDTPLGDQHP